MESLTLLVTGKSNKITVMRYCSTLVCAALLCPQRLWMIWLDYYLFKLTAGRERGVLGELGWLITRERAAQYAVNLGFSRQKRSVLTETQVTQESFSALSISGWHDTPDEERKERHQKIRTKLACSPRSYIYMSSRVKVRKTCVYCRVNWPGCKWWGSPFPLHTKPRS